MISFDLVEISLAKELDVSARWCSWLNNPEVTKYSRQKEKKHTIETQRIFNLQKSKIKILIHEKSYIHAIIQFNNGLKKLKK